MYYVTHNLLDHFRPPLSLNSIRLQTPFPQQLHHWKFIHLGIASCTAGGQENSFMYCEFSYMLRFLLFLRGWGAFIGFLRKSHVNK